MKTAPTTVVGDHTMATKRQQRWPLGTKIQKLFEGYGEFIGEVQAYKDGMYRIVYEDGDTEEFDEGEMNQYQWKGNPSVPSLLPNNKCSSSASHSRRTPAGQTTKGREMLEEEEVDGNDDESGIDDAAKSPEEEDEGLAGEKDDDYDEDDDVDENENENDSDDDDADKDDEDDDLLDDGITEAERKRRERVMRDIESMHQELEVTGYAKSKSGHRKKVVPRHVSKVRTKKRKLLEKRDRAELAMMGEDVEDEFEDDEEGESEDNDEGSVVAGRGIKRRIRKKRLRGSRAALDADLLKESMVFQRPPAPAARGAADDADQEGDEEEQEDEDDDEEVEEDEEDLGEIESDDEPAKPSSKRAAKSKSPGLKKPTTKSKGGSSGTSSRGVKKRRRMYRLRNFQSFKMAQRHGDALAAHARGDHKTAIEKLKAVAKDAPSAPQVYSSLGMVYEDMLKESKGRYYDRKNNGDAAAITLEEGPVANPETEEGSPDNSPFIPNQYLREQCDLAKKAYGSHHVSAILCKKDFTLWVRAGESALEIAGVHEELLSFPELSEDLRTLHKGEKRRWQDEALRDIIVADNLKPPGIDVPAKLAAIHLELGNTSNSLSILTDLKNRSGDEFRASYKAWVLYSDLMLRLGHECIQWNQGMQANENYMVRRWLRKYSKSFDWQERRIQALALGLEAAAGTENTYEFVNWLRNRSMELGKAAEDDGFDLKETGANSNSTKDLQDERANSKSSPDRLKEERILLLRNQGKEINEFDQTTEDMELVPDSDPSKDREVARNSLLESHQSAVDTLEKEFGEQNVAPMNEGDNSAEIVHDNQTVLPISASVRVVCQIAGDLMKQLHGLQLYKGARLVGEAVANYMKERARRADRGISLKKRAEEWQQKVDNSPFFLEPYDEGDLEDEDEDDLPYLSDEEALIDDAEGSGILRSLRGGVLPTELRVLLALAMIGEGGRNFIATKYLEALHQLDQEPETWFGDGDKDTELSGEPRWFLFRRAMGETVTRTVAFAFLADVLKKTDKEAEWAIYFSPWFLSHVEALDERGVIEQLIVANRSKITPNTSIRKNQVLKVMLASCRLAMDTLDERDDVVLVLGGARPAGDPMARMGIAQNILHQLTRIIPLIWRVDRSGTLSNECVEVVSLSAKCISWLSQHLTNESEKTVVVRTLSKIQTIVSYFVGGNPIPDLEGTTEADGMKSLIEAARFPLSTTWQPAEFRPLSDRTYNIAASCNVPSFSGWENEKFSTTLLRRRCRNDAHWLNVVGKKLTGCFPTEIENEMKNQFDLLENLEPGIPNFKFVSKLKLVKDSHWYKQKVHEDGDPDLADIAQFGEEDILLLFLSFSKMNLMVAEMDDDKNKARRREQLALSVLLPLCHFCLDENVWDSLSIRPESKQSFPTARAQQKSTVSPSKDQQSDFLSVERKHQKQGVPEIEKENTEVGEEKGEYEEWRNEIFEPMLNELQPNWENNETRVLDGPGAIAAAVSPAEVPATSRRRTWKPAPKSAQRTEKLDVTDTTMLHSFVPIPLGVLRTLWNTSIKYQELPTQELLDVARCHMKRIHKKVIDLRSCFTIPAIEKICLHLSVSLLDLAAMPGCKDPFFCLQQAAMYASHASKAGNSDVAFRRRIPKAEDCTPLNALAILGRADCLHSVFFPREAAFLCSFVARQCAKHRDFFDSNHECSDQWKVVAMYANNVSVMIRTTVHCMIHHSNHNKQLDLSCLWENSVLKEFEKARKDAVDLFKRPLDQTDDEKPNEQKEAIDSCEKHPSNRSDTDTMLLTAPEKGVSSPRNDSQSPADFMYDPDQLQDRISAIMIAAKEKPAATEMDEEDEITEVVI